MNKVALLSPGSSAGAHASDGRRDSARYWAFLSYSHSDSETADWLHSALEKYRIPKALIGRETPAGPAPRAFTPIFRDRQELAASSDLGREIREAIGASRFLVVLCSPASARSRWVDQEVRDFKRLHGEERVLAAILDGEPFSTDEKRECFPPSLRRQIGPDGRFTGLPAEPIAADFRKSGDGRRGGFLKLVAGMLDVGLDDLVQRNQQRRQKRMAWIVAASLLGMAFTSGMAVVAINARDAARDERREAEGLVEFMLGDLKGKLEPIGKLEALDGVGGRILEYYSKQKTSELDDAGLLQRARALSMTAQVAYLRADMDAAERLYREALAGTAEAINRDPSDPQRLFDHAQNVFWIGELARVRGRTEQAEAANREYQRLANNMVRLDPSNPKWQMEKVYATENIAIAFLNRRRFVEAGKQFDAALGPMTAMVRTYPDNSDYQRELSTLLAWLADSRRDEGRLKEATATRERQIAFLSEQLARIGANVRLQEHLIPARQALGILLTSQGLSERGLEQLRLAIAEADRLIPIEPDNALWRGYAAGVRLELASTLIALRRTTRAEQEMKAGCELTADLRARDPNVASWREFQTNCLSIRSRLALVRGSLPEALGLALQARESTRTERNIDPIRTRYRVAAVQRLIGDIHRRMGNPEAARKAWAAGLAQLPPNVPERPREMDERYRLLSELRRDQEAAKLRDRLSEMQYKIE